MSVKRTVFLSIGREEDQSLATGLWLWDPRPPSSVLPEFRIPLSWNLTPCLSPTELPSFLTLPTDCM